jgi:tetratricopeptide (TPR) repeat protein
LIMQYRARQKRIQAQHALDSNDRVRLLRETESMLRKCLDMDPEDGRTYVTLGKLLVQQRRYDEALALYEAGSAATGGTNAHIWTAWAYLAERRGNISLARRLYDAALVASPIHAAAYHGWGLLEKKEGNFGAARDIWTKGINATKDIPNPYLYQSLAVLAADLDRPEEARRWFNAGTKTVLGSNSTALWQAWALMEQRRGSDPEAVRFLYRRALQASPRSRYTFLSWALWEKDMGNFAEARKLFKSGSYLNATDAAILQAWALMEEQLGDRQAARRLFHRASEADPSHLYVWQAWGCMEQRDGNLDAARELFQQGIWAAPPRDRDTTLIFQAWAILEREAGNAELARELFKCAVKADPSSEPSWLAWAEMEEELGFFERANELRTYNMQERQQVTMPGSFSTLPRSERSSLLTPFFEAINKWFNRYEEASKQHDVQTHTSDIAFSDKAT